MVGQGFVKNLWMWCRENPNQKRQRFSSFLKNPVKDLRVEILLKSRWKGMGTALRRGLDPKRKGQLSFGPRID